MDADGLTSYGSQSRVSNPGEMTSCLVGLPGDVSALARVVNGLVIHYRADDPIGQGIPEERLSEIDTRYAEAMLARLAELDDGPLTRARLPVGRLVGCCRDFTVLLLTLARAHGIPARARVGFAGYFVPGFNVDHEVAEVWDSAERRWRLIDAELATDHRDPTDGAPIDPDDVPRERFLVGGAAWQRCRAGTADPESFVVSPDLDIPATRGWPYLRHNLIHDLAALNKHEMILWDYWGLMLRDEVAEHELEALDRVAATTARSDPDLAELRRLYADGPRLAVPHAVTSYSPLTGESRTVAVG